MPGVILSLRGVAAVLPLTLLVIPVALLLVLAPLLPKDRREYVLKLLGRIIELCRVIAVRPQGT